jgi:hypothetical protein
MDAFIFKDFPASLIHNESGGDLFELTELPLLP